MKDDGVVGVLTQKDITKKFIAKRENPNGIQVEAVMSSPVIGVPQSNSVFSASKTMKDTNIRRLVVMDGKTVCGIITQTNICRAIEDKVQTEEEELYRLRQVVKDETTANILCRIEHVLDGIIASMTLINNMMSQTDIQNLGRSDKTKEVHSPDNETFPAAIPQDKIIRDGQIRVADFRRELQTLAEEVIHIRNIIAAERE
jgi:signal-transduction protein with cAMP-binding, CBS, and nucleotidyltransferase domain